jgi:hypothetical protein
MIFAICCGVITALFVMFAINSIDDDSSEFNYTYHVISPIFIGGCLLTLALMSAAIEDYNSIKTLEVSSEQYIELRDICVTSPKTKGKAFVKAYEDGKITQLEYINIKKL